MPELPENWKIKDGKLSLELALKDFKEAINLIDSIAHLAETYNHHPDILLHDYNNLLITTFTHSESQLTDKDYQLARAISEIL